MTPLEERLYLALLGCRPIIVATASTTTNPATLRLAALVDSVLSAYKTEQAKAEGEADGASEI